MTSGNSTDAACVFRTAGRLRQAKTDLYGYLLRHGVPQDGRMYLPGAFQDRFPQDSPIRAALQAWPSGGSSVNQRDALTYLCAAIYRSELNLNVTDHFDSRLPALLAMPGPVQGGHAGPDMPAAPAVAAAVGQVGTGSRWLRRVGRSLVAAVVLWLAATVGLAALAEGRAVARLSQAADAWVVAAAALIHSLPMHYAGCLAGADKPCGDAPGGPTGRASRDLDIALHAGADLVVALGRPGTGQGIPVSRYLTARTAEDCGAAPTGAPQPEGAAFGLCLAQVRLAGHQLCVTGAIGPDDDLCRDNARLATVATRFEPPSEIGVPQPVDIFSRPLELPAELAGYIALAATLPRAVTPHGIGRATVAAIADQYRVARVCIERLVGPF